MWIGETRDHFRYIYTWSAPASEFSFEFISFRAISLFFRPPAPVYIHIALFLTSDLCSYGPGSFLALGRLHMLVQVFMWRAALVLDHQSTYEAV